MIALTIVREYNGAALTVMVIVALIMLALELKKKLK